MKKLSISLAILFAILIGLAPITLANDEAKKEETITTVAPVESVKDIDVLATMNQPSKSPNRIWVGTFQIVWNEFMDNIVYGPIRFANNSTPKMVKELNKKNFKKSDISEDSYYTKYGIVSPNLKSEIEKGIEEKFNETSDILNLFDWSYNPNKLFVYAMLKKDFKFLTAFDKLPTGGFAKNTNPVEYFGIDSNSDRKLYKNVKVLFFNSDEDFAVKLLTKNNDNVILYRTNDDLTFDKYYKDLNKKTKKYRGSKKFNHTDRFLVPDISLYQETNFPDVEGEDIKGTNLKIDRTIETIDFKMDNEGVKLKSEAAIMAKMTALRPEKGRHFYYNDNFVLFLVEENQKTPYYAMKVSDIETLNKTSKDKKVEETEEATNDEE